MNDLKIIKDKNSDLLTVSYIQGAEKPFRRGASYSVPSRHKTRFPYVTSAMLTHASPVNPVEAAPCISLLK